ncbi:tryptophan--tRNA ligase [soil metagenome]
MKRILSGINPSSAKGLHIGNYFGMAKPALALQQEGECFYFIADLHSLNTVFNPQEVAQNTMQIFTEFLALGIDTTKTHFYVESDIPAIPYLQTILNNVVTVAELKRMHAYKDKMKDESAPDTISMGLFSYVVLQSADILAFHAHIVPVGEDQAQHIEMSREIARSFNNRYGNIVTVPEVSIRKEVSRVTGIDGERKMSKSLGNDIPIFADEAIVKKQIMTIKTDPARIHPTDPGDPAKNVTFTYLELLEYDQHDIDTMKERYRNGTIGDVEIKKKLFEVFMDYFKPVRAKNEELKKNSDYINQLRKESAEKANKIADKTLQEVKKAVGFRSL